MVNRRALVVTVLVTVASVSFGWNPTGHMVIARIAELNLRTEVRLECERLLKIDATPTATDFVTTGPWADDIRNARPDTGPWHYTNIHFRADGRPSRLKPDRENVVVAIEQMTAVVADKSKPDAMRAEALRFLIHFVGDIHQPLHTTARDTDATPSGDRGGNDFAIIPPGSISVDGRGPKNLHALWDRGAGLFPEVSRPLNPTDRELVNEQAKTLMASLPRTTFPSLSHVKASDWAVEGFILSRDKVYKLEPNTMPNSEYLRMAQATSARQVTLAGYRLADLLNKIVK